MKTPDMFERQEEQVLLEKNKQEGIRRAIKFITETGGREKISDEQVELLKNEYKKRVGFLFRVNFTEEDMRRGIFDPESEKARIAELDRKEDRETDSRDR